LIYIHFHALAEGTCERETVEVLADVAVIDGTDVEEDNEHRQQTERGNETDYDTNLLTAFVNQVERNVSRINTAMY